MQPFALKIDSFRNEFRFLSNFSTAYVEFDNIIYPTAEHAYQAAKTLDIPTRVRVLAHSSPQDVRKFGRKIPLRNDWDDVKVNIMRQIISSKFSEPVIRQKLLDTGDAELIEGNSWGDTFWGKVNGVGSNWLGKILMEERERARSNLRQERMHTPT